MQALVFSFLTVPCLHRQSLVISQLHGWNLFVSLILERRPDNLILEDLQSEGRVRNSSTGCCMLPRTIFHTRSLLRPFRTLYPCPSPSIVPWYLYTEKNQDLGIRERNRQISIFCRRVIIHRICRETRILTNKNRNDKYPHDVSWHGDVLFFGISVQLSNFSFPLLTSNLLNTPDFYTQPFVLHRVCFLVSNREDSMHDTR